MFKIAANKTFEAIAKVHIPGQERPAEINLTFKYLNKKEFEAWTTKHHNRRTAQALNEIIVDWDVVDPDNNKVTYSLENLIALTEQLHTVEQDITTAYLSELYGAKQKN